MHRPRSHGRQYDFVFQGDPRRHPPSHLQRDMSAECTVYGEFSDRVFRVGSILVSALKIWMDADRAPVPHGLATQSRLLVRFSAPIDTHTVHSDTKENP